MNEQLASVSWIWLVVASIAVLALGIASTGLWIPAAMMFDGPGAAQNPAVIGFALYSSAGPLAALIGLVAGWFRVFQGARGSGLKWMIVVPAVWLVGLLGLFLAWGLLDRAGAQA